MPSCSEDACGGVDCADACASGAGACANGAGAATGEMSVGASASVNGTCGASARAITGESVNGAGDMDAYAANEAAGVRSAGASLCIRSATPADAPALLSIYAPYVRETAITFEYEVPSVEEFRARIERTLGRYPYLVAERDGRPVGYAYAGPLGVRAAYDWSVEGSIYVARDARRTGAGRALYEALEAELARRGFVNLFACVTEPALADDPYSNRNSIEFHEHMGYKLVGEFERCGQKFGRWYNVVWMQKVLAEPVPGAPHPDF